jgi:spore maturation protein CgeB
MGNTKTKLLYSFNKKGFELDYWMEELSYINKNIDITPFNHGEYIGASNYIRAQLLENLYFKNDPRLLCLYKILNSMIRKEKYDYLLVDNANPYHPDFLKNIKITKILRTSDGPTSTYDRDIPYYHAFDMVLYNNPAFSKDMTTNEKLTYCGVKNKYLWKMCSFKKLRSNKTKNELLTKKRDVDITFVGSLFPCKMKLLAAVKKEFGTKFRLHGLANWKKNFYFNVVYGFPCLVRPISFDEYVPLYERTKIGINTHINGPYTLGGYRLFDLPANGVMQISDGGDYLDEFFKVGVEIERYDTSDELIDKIKFYLNNDSKREKIARAGYDRVMRDHTIEKRLQDLSDITKIKL